MSSKLSNYDTHNKQSSPILEIMEGGGQSRPFGSDTAERRMNHHALASQTKPQAPLQMLITRLPSGYLDNLVDSSDTLGCPHFVEVMFNHISLKGGIGWHFWTVQTDAEMISVFDRIKLREYDNSSRDLDSSTSQTASSYLQLTSYRNTGISNRKPSWIEPRPERKNFYEKKLLSSNLNREFLGSAGLGTGFGLINREIKYFLKRSRSGRIVNCYRVALIERLQNLYGVEADPSNERSHEQRGENFYKKKCLRPNLNEVYSGVGDIDRKLYGAGTGVKWIDSKCSNNIATIQDRAIDRRALQKLIIGDPKMRAPKPSAGGATMEKFIPSFSRDSFSSNKVASNEEAIGVSPLRMLAYMCIMWGLPPD
ncbi:hypothetical protein RF11_14252 [Thelohanellus kitauei]|uniref:Uncharacterized protein n=1 Tax=Thelohanellus kitauei TaxID=669202 RepID=A0A0C2IJR2_THEKT|nr:hypothetical protein RF11_14252 [Thelohanellus kitauei]